jgi:bacillithiol system protein YtxJ
MHGVMDQPSLAHCLAQSHERPVLLFKHSTACSISAAAYRQMSAYEQNRASADPEVYLIKVIESRAESNAAAEQLGVPHKSPQLILVKDGNAVWSTSHHNIYRDKIAEGLAGLGS